ncbi:hypothetical protein M9H77_03029 [Catharanthus roseus]|uniref:Uncharacterized protein n=1 Tax=Catharanthus roseus TaxID=4058 RepID=A0ACC0CA49_CATRO|nr:hypothetical protein M9H77_03029 [Catharanthus roseus]
MRQFSRAQMVPNTIDTCLDLHRIQLRGNDNTYWGTQHAIHLDAWYQWRIRVRDGPTVAAEALSYLSDEYIRWYRGITWVYIGNPANRDTCAHGYQPVDVDRRMMVDDMASMVIREPPSSLSQMAVVMKKVQTIIRRYMVSIGGTLGCTPSQHDIQQTFPMQLSRHRPRKHVPDRGAHGVKRGARRHPGHGAGGGHPPVPPAPERHEHVNPGHAFRVLAPPPPGTFGSSTLYQPISQASLSEEEEQEEYMDGVQHFGFGHRVGKKTMRFTPSDWP